MLFWMSFPLLNAVVGMALTTHSAEGSNCRDGCPLHSINGVALPVDDIRHNISIWMEEDKSIRIDYYIQPETGRKWTNITTKPDDNGACIVLPKELEEPEYCLLPGQYVVIEANTDNSLGKLDCKRNLCGCQHHRLIGLRIGRHFVPKVFWWPTQNISMVVVSKKINEYYKDDYYEYYERETLKVPSSPKWHDFSISGRSTKDSSYHVVSSSLNVNMYRDGNPVWIYGINDEGQKIPSYFALGCDNEPTEYPGDTTEVNDKDQEMTKEYPGETTEDNDQDQEMTEAYLGETTVDDDENQGVTKETYDALCFFLFVVAVVLS